MASATALNVSVSSVIAADADTLYGLVADVTKMADFSPEVTKVVWTGKTPAPEVGATFKGSNKLGFLTWSTKPTVTVAEPGRQFAFKVNGAGGPTWTYTFEPVAGGTKVTESMSQDRPSPAIIRGMRKLVKVNDRAANLEAAMTETLRNIAVAAS
jgi:hypothetical protein